MSGKKNKLSYAVYFFIATLLVFLGLAAYYLITTGNRSAKSTESSDEASVQNTEAGKADAADTPADNPDKDNDHLSGGLADGSTDDLSETHIDNDLEMPADSEDSSEDTGFMTDSDVQDRAVSVLDEADISDINGIASLELPVSGASGYAAVPMDVFMETEDVHKAAEIKNELNLLLAQKDELMLILDNYMLVYASRGAGQDIINQLPQGLDVYGDRAALDNLMNTLSMYVSIEKRIDELEESYSEYSPLEELKPGTAFCIIKEEGDLWQIDTGWNTGWVENTYCFINLPDVLPSIVYNITNADSSLFRSSGKDIQDITGKKLFDARDFNERLCETEYIVPVLYKMSKKIGDAQHIANKYGDTLVIYEGFRPMSAQKSVGNELLLLMEWDDEVRHGVSDAPWSIGWFIARDISNHQKGYAIDVTIAKIDETEQRVTGNTGYIRTKEYTEYNMPTAMHELSRKAALYSSPNSTTYASSINNAARRLQNICRKSGLSPLASEWWHFNDLDCVSVMGESGADGRFFTNKSMSREPFDE